MRVAASSVADSVSHNFLLLDWDRPHECLDVGCHVAREYLPVERPFLGLVVVDLGTVAALKDGHHAPFAADVRHRCASTHTRAGRGRQNR